jgi:hypothetical protein
MTRKLASIGMALVVGAAMGGAVLAADATVPTVTGCLANKDATLIKVKLGDAPASPCSGGQTLVHLSGGDITSITVGEGLTGGGTNGDITIGLDASFTLPQGCVAGDIVEKTSSGWTCGIDDDTTYSAGTGLDLSVGNAFSIEPDNLVQNGEACTTGQLVTGINSSGHITCAAPPAPSAGQYVSTSVAAVGIPDDDAYHSIGALNPGGGTYFIIAKAVVFSAQNADQFTGMDCAIFVDGTSRDHIRINDDTLNEVESIPLALTTVFPVTNGFSLQCRANDGADGVELQEVKLIGVKL